MQKFYEMINSFLTSLFFLHLLFYNCHAPMERYSSASLACHRSTPCRRRPSGPARRCWRRRLAELFKGEIWRRAKSKEVKSKNFMK